MGTQEDSQTGEREDPVKHEVWIRRKTPLSKDEVLRGSNESREVDESTLPRKAAIALLVPVPQTDTGR